MGDWEERKSVALDDDSFSAISIQFWLVALQLLVEKHYKEIKWLMRQHLL